MQGRDFTARNAAGLPGGRRRQKAQHGGTRAPTGFFRPAQPLARTRVVIPFRERRCSRELDRVRRLDLLQ